VELEGRPAVQSRRLSGHQAKIAPTWGLGRMRTMERSLQHLQETLRGQPQDNSGYFEDVVAEAVGMPPKSVGSAEDRLNELGRDGWELVSIYPNRDNAVAFFKKKYP
jgi:hypothetical protein